MRGEPSEKRTPWRSRSTADAPLVGEGPLLAESGHDPAVGVRREESLEDQGKELRLFDDVPHRRLDRGDRVRHRDDEPAAGSR